MIQDNGNEILVATENSSPNLQIAKQGKIDFNRHNRNPCACIASYI